MGHIKTYRSKKNEKKMYDPRFMHSILIKTKGKTGIRNHNVPEPWVEFFLF